MRHRLSAWLPVVLWAAVIFGLSSIPGTRLPTIDLPQSDKIAHTLVYGVFGALVLRGLEMTRGRELYRTNVVVALLLTTAYGVSDEIHQLWTPNRTSDWRDVIADACGGMLGVMAIVAMRWMKFRGCLMMVRSKNRKCSPTRERR